MNYIKTTNISLLLTIVIISSACSENKETINVSVKEIIKNKKQYDGKPINVEGILSVEFENMALYQTKEDKSTHKPKKSLWLNFSDESYLDLTKLLFYKFLYNNEKVIVSGKFNKTDKGHLSSFSGTLIDITKIEKK